ncbi:hypothetical protein Hanom_Chr16g01422901 [Helianthus anomalus]
MQLESFNIDSIRFNRTPLVQLESFNIDFEIITYTIIHLSDSIEIIHSEIQDQSESSFRDLISIDSALYSLGTLCSNIKGWWISIGVVLTLPLEEPGIIVFSTGIMFSSKPFCL